MAGIYIPNMTAETAKEKLHDFIYIPVPDHGRLIDADALWETEKRVDALHKLRPKGESVMFDAGFLSGYRAAAKLASIMPTIIPADKEAGE